VGAVTSHRLIVRSRLGDRAGTAWLVRENLVATAFHVVGLRDTKEWLHQADEQCRYLLLVGESELALTPQDFDASADLALLRLDAPDAALHPLLLAMVPPQHGDRWHCDGFPRNQGGRPFTLTGMIAAVRSDSVQLTTDQGTIVPWEGISGAPLYNASGEVVAVMTDETASASTMWATHVAAVRALLSSHQTSGRFDRAGYEALLHSDVSWVHLSDLHLGAQHGRWPDMRYLALRDLGQQAVMHGPPDLILVTGDLSDSGEAEQFERVTVALHEIRDAVGGDPIIVPVPGNHDLARPNPASPAARGFRNYRRDQAQRELIRQGEPDACADLKRWFKNYTDWLEDRMVPAWRRQQVLYEPGLLPGDLRLTIHLRGIRLGLVGVNSAFLDLGDGNRRGELIVEREQLGDSPSAWIERHHAAFLLLHHHPAWLAEEDAFHESIYPVDRFVACFFGHAWTSPRAEENRGKRLIGAPSLFGRERCDGDRSERAYGYWWGRLSWSNEIQGQVRLWRRRVERTDDGRTFAPAGVEASRPEHTSDARLREVREPTPTPQVRSVSEAAWTAVVRFSDDSLQKAVEIARTGNVEDAVTELRRIRGHLEAMNAQAPGVAPQLHHQWLDTRLHEAGCLLGMQRIEEGGAAIRILMDELRAEDPYLSEERRILMAQMLAQTDEPQRARKLVAGLESKAAAAVRQVVTIIEDEIIPDNLLDDAFVRLHACGLWSEQGEHDRATQEALRVLDLLEAEGTLTANQASVWARAVQAVLVAVGQSINEVPPGCAAVEETRLERAIRVLQRFLDPRDTPLRGLVLDRYLALWIANFQHLSWDGARLSAARDWLRNLGEDDTRYRVPAQDDPSGDVSLPESAPAWARVLDEARKLRRAGKLDQALGLLKEAIDREPGRPHPLLHREAAILLGDKGESEEAVDSAERAFRAFPGHGQAIFFAWFLQLTGQADRIWRELKTHLEGSPDLEARWLLAWAAVYASPGEAPAYWQSLVEDERFDATDKALTRVRWAQSLAHQGKTEQAADESWQAFLSRNLFTRADALVVCVKLHWESSHPERASRLRILLEALWELAAARGDRLAREEYVEYWQRMDRPAELPQPDLERSLEEGALVAVDREQLRTYGQALHARRLRSEHAYAQGVLPLELRARAEMREQAEMFERMLDREQLVRVPLTAWNRMAEIRGRKVLLGAFELLILDHVDLLFEFDEALGRDGGVILFEDVYQGMLRAPSRLADRGVLFEHIDRISDGLQPTVMRASARGRARRVRSWVVSMELAGRLRRMARPEFELPASHDNPEARELRTWFLHALSWREALHQQPDAVLLCVDALSTEGVTADVPAPLYWALAERTPDGLARMWERLDAVADRVASFAATCRELAGARRRGSVLEKLTRLGFVDAFTREDLLRLAERPGGLSHGDARRVLDGIETRSHQRDVFTWLRHLIHVAELYAGCIARAWLDPVPAAQGEDVTRALVARAPAVDDLNGHALLRLLVHILLERVVGDAATSFVVSDGVARLSLQDSVAGQMWQAIARWLCEQPDTYQNDFEEVFQQEAASVLLMIDESKYENLDLLKIKLGPLIIASDALSPMEGRPLFVPGSLGESIAILSALWPDEIRPMGALRLPPVRGDDRDGPSVEEMLQRAANACITERESVGFDGISLRVRLTPEEFPLTFPASAAFLRLPREARARSARDMILAYGADDGRIVPSLQRIAANPDDREALHAYARLSIRPPWQTFRRHPEIIAQWGVPILAGFSPAELRELKELLSEPETLPAQSSLFEILRERADNGAWKERIDSFNLLERCGEIVGAPSLPLMWRLSANALDIDESLRRLDHTYEQPAARVACDLFACLTIAGSAGPDVAELRIRVSTIIRRLLEQAAAEELYPADSLAACEPRLLQHAMWTVAAASTTARPTSRRDGSWLTWCLYQWMIRQLEGLPDMQMRAGWQKLATTSPERPGITWTAHPDLLDPVRFGQGRLDVRLLAVLHALATAPLEETQWLVSSELRELLEKIHRRPFTQEEREVQGLQPASVLVEWGHLPRTVPELAGHILLRWYPLGHLLNTGVPPRGHRKRRKKKRRKQGRRN
jgi:tetratricopeptide (TPR) repeat protein